jgi:hypothetical protein
MSIKWCKNPVENMYLPYSIDDKIPITYFSSYIELLKVGSQLKDSAILVNTVPTKIDSDIELNFTFPLETKVMFVLNIEFIGKARLQLNGSNYSISNIEFKNKDKNIQYSSHIITINASYLTIINLSVVNVTCKDNDIDFIRTFNTVTNLSIYNSLFDGKKNTGVFLRLDFPFYFTIKNCVFQNFLPISASNGGEMIRLATSAFETKKSFCTIDSCYFTNCQGDPEIVSIKCSSVTIKNCVFEKNGGRRLVFRHTHNSIASNCFFSGSAMRIYGSNHLIENIQLTDGANILLDNKEGSGYVVAENCKLNNIYYYNGENPITNNGIKCIVSNVTQSLKFPKDTFFNNLKQTPASTPAPASASTSTSPTSTSTSSSTSTNLQSGFSYLTEAGVVNLMPIKLTTRDKFTIYYKSNTLNKLTFVLKIKNGNIIKTEYVPNSFFYLFGQIKNDDINITPVLQTINTVGVYEIEVIETNERISFEIIKPNLR